MRLFGTDYLDGCHFHAVTTESYPRLVDDYRDVVMILFNMINQPARERVLVECGGSREDPPGWVTRESDARTLSEAAYRFVRHEPGIDVTLSGTGSSRASIRSPRSRGATPARARGRRRCRALFDSGASYSLIRPDIAEEIGTPEPLADPEDWVFETAEAGHLMAATHRVAIDFRFDDSEARFSDEFVILPGCSEEVIVGATTMQKWQITLDFAAERVNYRKTAQRLRV